MVKYSVLLAEQTKQALSDKEQEFLNQMEEITDDILTTKFASSGGSVYVPEKEILPLIHTLNNWRRDILIKEWKKIYENADAGWKIHDHADERNSITVCYEFRKRQ